MNSDFLIVSQFDFLLRSSKVLSDCSNECLALQETLSPLLEGDLELSELATSKMQSLDKISQQLDDLSKLFSACSSNFDHRPAAFSTAVFSLTKLMETRERVFGQPHVDTTSGDLDLF